MDILYCNDSINKVFIVSKKNNYIKLLLDESKIAILINEFGIFFHLDDQVDGSNYPIDYIYTDKYNKLDIPELIKLIVDNTNKDIIDFDLFNTFKNKYYDHMN